MEPSVKTLDTMTVAKIANPQQIFYSLKQNIDAITKFKKYELLGKELTSEMIKSRQLHLAIPKQTPSVQLEQVSKALQYGEQNGVKIHITVVEW